MNTYDALGAGALVGAAYFGYWTFLGTEQKALARLPPPEKRNADDQAFATRLNYRIAGGIAITAACLGVAYYAYKK